MLGAPNAPTVYIGLQCLLALSKVYRYKAGESRGEYDEIAALTFPQLLDIGNRVVTDTDIEAGEMLRIIIKCYKHAIYVRRSSDGVLRVRWLICSQFDLPGHLRKHEHMVGWCTLFLTVVTKDPPPAFLSEDIEEREKNHWWKAKKGAYANLNRLFAR